MHEALAAGFGEHDLLTLGGRAGHEGGLGGLLFNLTAVEEDALISTGGALGVRAGQGVVAFALLVDLELGSLAHLNLLVRTGTLLRLSG